MEKEGARFNARNLWEPRGVEQAAQRIYTRLGINLNGRNISELKPDLGFGSDPSYVTDTAQRTMHPSAEFKDEAAQLPCESEHSPKPILFLRYPSYRGTSLQEWNAHSLRLDRQEGGKRCRHLRWIPGQRSR